MKSHALALSRNGATQMRRTARPYKDSRNRSMQNSQPYNVPASNDTSSKTLLGTERGCSICGVNVGRAQSSRQTKTPNSPMLMHDIGHTHSAQKVAHVKGFAL